ncbi:MAG: hypothetical protein ABSF83_04520 [Nitrososphaerales archaeon]
MIPIVTASALVSFIVILVLIPAPAPSVAAGTEGLPSWATPGADVVYSGKIDVDSTILRLTYEVRVLAVNSTKAEVLSMQNMTIGVGAPITDENVAWVKPGTNDGSTFFFAASGAAAGQYSTTHAVQGKTIPVTADSLQMQTPNGLMLVTTYFDSPTGLPVAIDLTMGSYPTFDLQVVSTNIPGLLPP